MALACRNGWCVLALECHFQKTLFFMNYFYKICRDDKATKTIHVTGTMLCENWDDATDRPLFTVDITASVSAPYSQDNNETDFAESFPTYSLITDDSDQGVIYVDARNENDAVAALENGRLVITKNGHRYNGMGVEMK